MIELRFYRDGGQTAVDVANQVAEFFGAAQKSLELALYDIRLHDEAAEIFKGALLGAQERGVAVRLVYNVDHPGPIPVPPPPKTAPELLEALPIPTRAIAGVPDLMHHKYVVRDREAIWTGSMNWSQDSWTRQENAIAIVQSPELARAYGINFDQLWEDGRHPRRARRPAAGRRRRVEVRPWFTPEHGEALAHRIAKRIGQAKRRIRIASPVISSGPILGHARGGVLGREGRRRRRRRRHAGGRRPLPVADERERELEGACAAPLPRGGQVLGQAVDEVGARHGARLHAREDHRRGRHLVPRQLQPLALRRAERGERARDPRREDRRPSWPRSSTRSGRSTRS